MYLALDKQTGDLILPASGGIERVADGRFIVQQVQCKLRTLLGEWIPDTTVGWLARSDFEKDYDSFEIEKRARTIILQTQGVLIINNLKSTYSQRKLSITFNATTVFGDIDLTVPWS